MPKGNDLLNYIFPGSFNWCQRKDTPKEIKPPPKQIERTCSVKQAARHIGVSGGTIYKLIRQGELTYLAAGRRKLPLVESVDAYIEAHTITEVPAPKQEDLRRKRDWSVLYS
jgi:excisionase family DNA binding protein